MIQIDNIGLKEAQTLQTDRRRGKLFKGPFRQPRGQKYNKLKKILPYTKYVC